MSIAPEEFVTGGFHDNSFEAFLSRRSEPSWLQTRRQSAFGLFKTLPLPTLRDEEWRRTDIRGLKLDDFGPLISADPDPSAITGLEREVEGLKRDGYALLTQSDGVTIQRPQISLPESVLFADLNTAVQDQPELLEKIFANGAYQGDADAFAALHNAFWDNGLLLYVPEGVRVETPLYHLIALSKRGRVDLSHTLIVLEEGAEASLIQRTTSLDREKEPGLHLGGVQIIQHPKSRLDFTTIQEWDAKTWHLSRDRAVVGSDAALNWTVGAFGSRLSKVNQDVTLVGERGRARINGVIFTSERQNLSYLTRQDHQAPNTTSDLLYKGAQKDRSRMVWRGMIKVDPIAQHTDAYQKNENLVLDSDARADSIPGLEIEANEVRCTHGATAGPVDPSMVFYLRSRGIDEATATRLIVEGFFASLYDRIPLDAVCETLAHAVARKLGHEVSTTDTGFADDE